MGTYMLAMLVDRGNISVMQLRLVISVMQKFTSVSAPFILLIACGVAHDRRNVILASAIGAYMYADVSVTESADISVSICLGLATAERTLILRGV